MTNKTTKTKTKTKTKKKLGKRVVFRADREGVYALFPDDPATHNGLCLCYVMVGGHVAADYEHCITTSFPAAPKQYAPLLRELKRIGYNVQVAVRR